MKTLTAAGDVLRVARQLVSEEKWTWSWWERTAEPGSEKLLMGSVAEEAERLLCCPVLTVGPWWGLKG